MSGSTSTSCLFLFLNASLDKTRQRKGIKEFWLAYRTSNTCSAFDT